MFKLNQKLKASTLLESMVAMVLLMMCFGISLKIYLDVSMSGDHQKTLKAENLLKKIAIETVQEDRIKNEILLIENLRIEKKISSYHEIDKLQVLCITAFDEHGKIMAFRRELIMINPHTR